MYSYSIVLLKQKQLASTLRSQALLLGGGGRGDREEKEGTKGVRGGCTARIDGQAIIPSDLPQRIITSIDPTTHQKVICRFSFAEVMAQLRVVRSNAKNSSSIVRLSFVVVTMVNFYGVSLALTLFVGAFDSSAGFSQLPRSFTQRVSTYHLSAGSLCAHPEFSVVGEEGEIKEEKTSESGDYFVVNNSDNDDTPDENSEQGTSKRPEYGALSPGTVVQVQIGDLALARKAWKKRRRTGSPLLVPCSVLNADRQSMVRWNLIYLLEKFGQSSKDGIAISETELAKRYRTFLKSSLKVCFDQTLSMPLCRVLLTKNVFAFSSETSGGSGV